MHENTNIPDFSRPKTLLIYYINYTYATASAIFTVVTLTRRFRLFRSVSWSSRNLSSLRNKCSFIASNALWYSLNVSSISALIISYWSMRPRWRAGTELHAASTVFDCKIQLNGSKNSRRDNEASIRCNCKHFWDRPLMLSIPFYKKADIQSISCKKLHQIIYRQK